MTTIENPTTEKMNGSSRMTTHADSPWWMVRPSLAAGLLGSFGLAAIAFQYAGVPVFRAIVATRAVPVVMQLLSATPTLIALAVFACAIMFRQNSGRSLRVMCALLALASITGASFNSMRDSQGRGPVENWVEKALPEAKIAFDGREAAIEHTSPDRVADARREIP
jgi:hypothetical protein